MRLPVFVLLIVLVLSSGCSSSSTKPVVPAPTPQPSAASAPDAQDELERQTRGVVVANLPRLRACYEDALATSPDMTGRVILVVDVAQNGKAAHVLEGRREGLSDSVIHCLSRTLKTLSFHDGAARTIRIQIPFNFSKRE